MTKILVVNSFGPMASTLLSGLLEKFGYTNVPVRKLGLHQYLMGELDLHSGYMQLRLNKIIQDHSTLGRRGGVSVIDRDGQLPKALCDYERVKERIENIHADNIQDLYMQCRKIYYDAVVYKTIDSNRDWHIEMTTDIHRYDHKALFDAYHNHFDDVKMLHLHRPIEGWLNALASQAFVHPQIKNRIRFFPHLRVADYKLYEEAVEAMPGMHIEFDDLFDTPLPELSKNLAEFLGVSVPACDFENESYDMYGKFVPFEKAFKRFDDKLVFLSKATQARLSKMVVKKQFGKLGYNVYAWWLYLKDLILYHLRKSK